MKRFLSLLLMFSLGLCLSSPAFGAEAGGFSDVQPEDWFAPYVEVCVEAGLMNGTGEGLFAPERELTDAECILLALRLRRASQELPLQLPAIPEGWGTLSLTAEDGTPLFSYLDLQGSTTNAQDLLTLWLPQEAAKPLAGQRGQLVIHGDVVLEGYFTVYEEDGFAQRAGFQIDAQYEHVGSFHEGLAAVALEGKAGFIDSQGEVVIPLELDSWVEGSYLYSGTEAYHFEQGVATVRQDGEWFLMDHAGTQVSPRRYDELSRWFTLGTVQYQDWDGPQGSGFLTPQGEERPIPALTDVNIMADCGACYLAQWPMLWAHTYLDREGKPLLPQWFLQAAPLVNGTALVQDFDGVYYRLELEL